MFYSKNATQWFVYKLNYENFVTISNNKTDPLYNQQKRKSSIGDWNGAINDNTLKDTSISCVPFKVKQDVWVCSSSATRNPSERITCNDFSHINVNCGHAWLTVVTVTLDKSMSGMVKQN